MSKKENVDHFCWPFMEMYKKCIGRFKKTSVSGLMKDLQPLLSWSTISIFSSLNYMRSLHEHYGYETLTNHTYK